MGLAATRVAGGEHAATVGRAVAEPAPPRQLPDPLGLLAVDPLVAKRAAHATAPGGHEVEPEPEAREHDRPLVLRRRGERLLGAMTEQAVALAPGRAGL